MLSLFFDTCKNGFVIVKVFTKDDYPETREAKDLAKKLEGGGFDVEYHDADDEHDTQLLEIYDVYSFPTFIIVEDNGTEIQNWRGIIPLESDVKQFLN